jgi:hypothetical protein
MNNLFLTNPPQSPLVNAILLTLVDQSRRDYNSVPKVNYYVQHTVNLYSLDDFRSIFRLSRHGFEILIKKLATTQAFAHRYVGRHQTDISEQCLLSLRYLGTQETLSSIADLFGLSEASAFLIIRRFCSAVIPKLSSELIKWPSENEQVSIAKCFATKCRLPPIIVGTIDCRENLILKPYLIKRVL